MAEESSTINLRILSPSTEVEGGVTFPDLPASTTVKELRSRIQNAVPSKPAPERMRLIYRGRVVANDADTLGNVFGAESIKENKDHSLHLVLRELPTSNTASPSPAPRTSSAPPNPFRPAQAPLPASPLQTNPFRTVPPPTPNAQPQTPQHPHVHPHVHHHNPPGPTNPPIVQVLPQLQPRLAQALAQNARARARSQARAHSPSTQGQEPNATAPPPVGAPTPPPGLVPPMGLGPQNMPGRTVRQEGIGPNGERWSVTYNQVNIPARPQHPMLPPHFVPTPAFGLPPTASPTHADRIDRLIARLRSTLDNARQEMQNVRTLITDTRQELASTNLPSWRIDHIRRHVHMMNENLDMVERGLVVILNDASQIQNADVLALRQATNELRIHAEEMNQMLAREQANTVPAQTPSTSAPTISSTAVPTNATDATPTTPSVGSTPSQSQVSSTTQTLPANTPAELFILSSPQGPVGILFDQRGTYSTAPMVQTLPFQTFTNQFAQNRQLIAGLGHQIAHGSRQWHDQPANVQPPATAGQAPQQPQNQAHGQAQIANQNQNQNQNANGNANRPAENDRMVNIGGHLWLILKLACFVYFFAGGGGLYRPIMLGIIAAIVYLAQVGVFEDQFNLVRRHFEALLPVGALADRAAQPREQQQRIGNLTPEQAAQRLLQQRRNQRFGWARESMRTVERAFALFVASLWPGIGERMVHAQEERLRLERVAETERREREEEAKRQEEARRQEAEAASQQQSEAKEDPKPEFEPEAAGGASAKGKEKVDATEGETSSAPPAAS